MKIKSFIFLSTVLLSACAAPTPDPALVQALAGNLASTLVAGIPTNTSLPTYTPQATYTPLPTYTVAPSQTPQIVVVTATSSPTPQYTPTETLPPTATLPPTPTKDPLMLDKEPGYYLVNVDISPGIWRSQGDKNESSCYWVRLTKTGDIIDNYFGFAGATIYIAPSDFVVELNKECGSWTYLGPP